ncbi:MAG: hypothetical protein Q9162_003182 [Coniocarpon cinnabarinum]
MSIQDRIASLNLSHVRTPAEDRPLPPARPASKPCLPPRLPPRSPASTQNIHVGAEDGQLPVGNQPARAAQAPEPPQRKERATRPLPPPRQVTHEAYHQRTNELQPPSAPSRNNASQTLVKRESNESISSTISARSSVSGISTRTSATTPSLEPRSSTFRVPSYDPNALPPLPPKKSAQARPTLHPSKSSSSLTRTKTSQRPPIEMPPLPPPRREKPPTPALPPRRTSTQNNKVVIESAVPSVAPRLPSRSQPTENQAPPAPKRSALSYGMNKEQASTPTFQAEANSTTADPPPVPTSSRPNLSALQASKPRMPFCGSSRTTTAPAGVCMKCRDFSGPDQHAVRFPRDSIPNDVNWLAESLAGPFPSHTDKARALFTWCHHNIDYNAHDFFNGSVKPSTPQTTLETGLAVCEGYASLFNAMALHVGLESVVVGGHGMGFAKKPITSNEPTPPEDATGHAWNVVKIDNNDWKLVDVCWGAGHIADDGNYQRHFHPERFTQSNDDFGLDHYPANPNQQFRNDGRIMFWDEYIRGPLNGQETLTVYTGCQDEHGIDEKSFQPRTKQIQVRGPGAQRVQFMFGSVCEHWDPIKMGKGKPYQYVLAVGGRDGRNRKNLPFRTNGRHWWLDVEKSELGCTGQSVHLYAVTSVNGENARGMTYEQYEAAVGRKGMGFGGVACWQLI